MKQLFLSFIFLFLASGVGAQVPGKFSFQGVAKNASGQPLSPGTAIKVSFQIHKDAPDGSIVHGEEHSLTVTTGGIFNVLIGGGGFQAGTPLNEINWATGSYFLQVELAVDNVTFVDMGTTQLVSVPYASYAADADRALEAKKWSNDDPVIQKGTFGQGSNFPSIGAGPRLIWYPGKAAFRAGENYNDAWEKTNIGNYSFAGNRGIASGLYSVAFGGAEASGNYTFSAGINAKAQGDYSSAFGSYSLAEGEASTAIGAGTRAKAFGGVALGVYNDVFDTPIGTYQGNAATDRIFQIGNGTLQSHTNALTVLRNGNVGIGNNVLAPTHILEVGGRARIRHSGSTAGIYFDDSGNDPVGFVGMQNDNDLGFYIGDKWIFKANTLAAFVEGNLFVSGFMFDSSDRRLKTGIVPVANSLDHISKLKGYNYYWKDKTRDQSLQAGLIAQEVEALFPELVKTDEKGMKSVNYVGLIPHLIEAIKDQNKQIVTLNERLNVLQQLEEQVTKLTTLIQNEGVGKDKNNVTTSAKNISVSNP
ncbi:tail fiber domain-containing protein [Dyadobacter bucti]|uniref:tail fiber domain-containing protein n=1 Tax=Dyadobacter bucti TaxID=2572203 RepID=UPI001408A1E6|nr:tail fiber domain-containing protein [Dyadobacter bucti]